MQGYWARITDGGDRQYFANTLGGLGQYYFGPLRDLRVLDHDYQSQEAGKRRLVYDPERGASLAQAFDGGVDGDRFFSVLEHGVVHRRDLDALASFCPCGLLNNPPERTALLDLFLARTEAWQAEGGASRRQTLGLLLDLADQSPAGGRLPLEGVLRVAGYTGRLPGGVAWRPSAPLTRAFRAWGAYQRNELLSVALQGLFAAVLRGIQHKQDGRFRSVSQAGEIARRLVGDGADLDLSQPLDTAIARLGEGLPPLEAWDHEQHEQSLGWAIVSRDWQKVEEAEAVAAASVVVLLTLLARGLDDYPYADIELDPAYFDPREVHLLSLRLHQQQTWKGMTVGDWVDWLATRWGVERHLQVALRKLRHEKRDTFQVRPLEDGLRVVSVPWPTFTGPRVSRAASILADLGLLDVDSEGVATITAEGKVELEVIRGG